MDHLLPYALVLVCPISMGVMMRRDIGAEKAGLERRIQQLERDAHPTREPTPAGPASPRQEQRTEQEARGVQA